MSKSTMQESFGPLKIRTNFVDDGTITKNKYVLQEIGQQLMSSKDIFTFGQLMHLALDFKQYLVFKVSSNNQPTHLQGPPFYVGSIAIFLHRAKAH